MDFFWTPTEIAVFAPAGVVVVGIIAFVGARLGSRDLRVGQDKLIKSQEESQARALKAQETQFQQARMHLFADKQAEAYQGMIGALLARPRISDMAPGDLILRPYVKALDEWNILLLKAQVPLYTYADEAIFQRMQDFTSTLREAVLKLITTATEVDLDDEEGVNTIERTVSIHSQLVHLESNNILAVLREAVKAIPKLHLESPI